MFSFELGKRTLICSVLSKIMKLLEKMISSHHQVVFVKLFRKNSYFSFKLFFISYIKERLVRHILDSEQQNLSASAWKLFNFFVCFICKEEIKCLGFLVCWKLQFHVAYKQFQIPITPFKYCKDFDRAFNCSGHIN